MILKYGRRILQILFGVSLLGLGSYLNVKANIGLAAWDAFSMGLSAVTGVEFSTMVILVSASIFLVVLLMRQPVGLGTILNTFLYGAFIRMWQRLIPLPTMDSFWPGVGLVLLAQASIAAGTAVYISGGMGCGPRDSLMTGLHQRLPRVPIGAIRTSIELAALAAGFLMGARVGAGTVIAAVSIGVFIQIAFRVSGLSRREIRHEDLPETARRVFGAEK